MYIWDKYKDTYFNLSYPSKSQIKKQLEVELETFVGTKKQIEEKEMEISAKTYKIYEENKEKYHKTQNEIINDFKNELFKSFTYPKIVFVKAYSRAYEEGHSSGYHEVENIFYKIVDDYMEVYTAGKNGVE